MSIISLISEITSLSNKDKAASSMRYFKTGKGHYGEGDVFVGLNVPTMRSLSKKYSSTITLHDVEKLLSNRIHEYRLIGLLILCEKYDKSTFEAKPLLVDFYLTHLSGINNWDLVDSSAPYILGEFLIDKGVKDREVLYRLVKSSNIWERRVSIVSTLALIRKGDFVDALKLSELLLKDSHDLIHKATGWVLREVGKKDESVLIGFLDKHYKSMPRTALRYSLERLSKKQKDHYMKK